MEMWFSDEHTEDVKLSIRVKKTAFSTLKVNFSRLMCWTRRSSAKSLLWTEI